MKTLTVKREGTSTEFSYEIVWDGSYERLAGCVENLKLPAKKACIVTDSTVSELYLEEVKNVLSPLFETVTAFVFPAGEASKNLDTVKDLYTHLIENHFERKDILLGRRGVGMRRTNPHPGGCISCEKIQSGRRCCDFRIAQFG